mmetsp:Transcript_38880/g.74480  ORF Transcript_38880/g.74480 Transcript_38880/m.74480 type:complete len:345 (+) Transcript_38880:866-1900(+)
MLHPHVLHLRLGVRRALLSGAHQLARPLAHCLRLLLGPLRRCLQLFGSLLCCGCLLDFLLGQGCLFRHSLLHRLGLLMRSVQLGLQLLDLLHKALLSTRGRVAVRHRLLPRGHVRLRLSQFARRVMQLLRELRHLRVGLLQLAVGQLPLLIHLGQSRCRHLDGLCLHEVAVVHARQLRFRAQGTRLHLGQRQRPGRQLLRQLAPGVQLGVLLARRLLRRRLLQRLHHLHAQRHVLHLQLGRAQLVPDCLQLIFCRLSTMQSSLHLGLTGLPLLCRRLTAGLHVIQGIVQLAARFWQLLRWLLRSVGVDEGELLAQLSVGRFGFVQRARRRLQLLPQLSQLLLRR